MFSIFIEKQGKGYELRKERQFIYDFSRPALL